MTKIHIKISDRGWILEKCASEISEANSQIGYSTQADSSAHIQYYMTYGSYGGRISPIEVGYFTHIEDNLESRSRFFEVARNMDHCVCHAERSAKELRDNGVRNVTVIRPGVDLEEFKPRLRIGVVGRTCHTGRKGEALVEQVMDVEGIDWFFTGSGWPGPALNVPHGEMASFYNSLDYVLVPARYEGGPMSVIEGLACGKEIISPDVGWVPAFPHIAFENGSANSLRSVLRSLLAKRYELRAAVQDCTWSAWAKEHLDLFERLVSKSRAGPTTENVLASEQSYVRSDRIVMLASHGNEQSSKGGPSIRIPRTVVSLKGIGVNAVEYGASRVRPDLVHVFNVWPAASSSRFLEECRNAEVPSVFSPIFLNLTNHQLFSKKIPTIFSENQGESLGRMLEDICRDLECQPNLPVLEPYPGYKEQVRRTVRQADHVVLLSHFERRCLDFLGCLEADKTSLVRNPVNADLFYGVDRELFRTTYGLSKYVLQVGRIETRKNQLLVAEACRRLGVTAVFIGHEGDAAYASLLRHIAGPTALFVPRISQADPMLASAVAGASAFCLPSWAEGAPLAALEAGAAGVPLILSDRSGEQEYFGDHALYVNPADLPGTMRAIDTALDQANVQAARERRSEHVRVQFSWERHAKETAAAYEKVFAKRASAPRIKEQAPNERIFFDVTDWAHADKRHTGTARVRCSQFRNLPAELMNRVSKYWRK